MNTTNNTNEISAKKFVSMEELDSKLTKIIDKMNNLEEKISRKADEVVFTQLLEHRSEIESLTGQIHEIENKIQVIQENEVKKVYELETKQENVVAFSAPKRKKIMNVFGM